jgi:hypothetical protein
MKLVKTSADSKILLPKDNLFINLYNDNKSLGKTWDISRKYHNIGIRKLSCSSLESSG